MNELVTLESPRERTEARAAASSPLPLDNGPGLEPLAFRLELQSMEALLTVLTTVARLGGRVTSLRAADATAMIALLAPTRVAHHVQPTLAQLIEVIAVTDI